MPVVWLSRPVQYPTPLIDRFCFRFIPTTKSWAWLWHAKEWVLGKPKPVSLSSEIFALDSSLPFKAGLVPARPDFSDTNGLRVWLLGRADCEGIRKLLETTPGAEVLCRPRIMTADAIGASLFTGSSSTLGAGAPTSAIPLGISVSYFPRRFRDGTDLFAAITSLEAVTNAASGSSPATSVCTNIDVALRLQIPKGRGVFIHNARPGAAGGRQVAVLLDPP